MTDIYTFSNLFERESLNVNKTGKQACPVDMFKVSPVNVGRWRAMRRNSGRMSRRAYRSYCTSIRRVASRSKDSRRSSSSFHTRFTLPWRRVSVEGSLAPIRERIFAASASGWRVTFLGISFSLGLCQTHDILAEVADFK